MAKQTTIIAYQCETCGTTWNDERSADVCCKEYHCTECGKKNYKYHTLCEACREKRDYEKAEKLTIEEYEARFPDHMIVINGDNYYSSVADLLDGEGQWEDEAHFELPDYCWGTERVTVELDADGILDNLIEEASIEDMEFPKAAYEEFRTFAAEWNEKWREHYFMPSDIVVLIPEAMRKEYMPDAE